MPKQFFYYNFFFINLVEKKKVVKITFLYRSPTFLDWKLFKISLKNKFV